MVEYFPAQAYDRPQAMDHLEEAIGEASAHWHKLESLVAQLTTALSDATTRRAEALHVVNVLQHTREILSQVEGT